MLRAPGDGLDEAAEFGRVDGVPEGEEGGKSSILTAQNGGAQDDKAGLDHRNAEKAGIHLVILAKSSVW